MKFGMIIYYRLDFNLMERWKSMEKINPEMRKIIGEKKKNSRIVHGVPFDINSFSLDKVLQTIRDAHKSKKHKER